MKTFQIFNDVKNAFLNVINEDGVFKTTALSMLNSTSR